MYVCMYVFMCSHTIPIRFIRYVYTYICFFTYIHTYMDTHTHARTHVFPLAWTFTCAHKYTDMHYDMRGAGTCACMYSIHAIGMQKYMHGGKDA